MLEELVVGMLHEESVGLSCHVFPAVYKLGDFFCKQSWCMDRSLSEFHAGTGYRSTAKTISFVEKKMWVSGSGIAVFLFVGTSAFGSVISYP